MSGHCDGIAGDTARNDRRAQHGIPVSGFQSSLGYYDAFRSAWLPANLIQAQRDDFGAHAYERIDEKGVFHTHWE